MHCAGGVCSGGVSAPGGVSTLGGVCCWGVSALGVSAQRGCIPACTEADTPPVNRMTDRQVQKQYLRKLRLRAVIIATIKLICRIKLALIIEKNGLHLLPV